MEIQRTGFLIRFGNYCERRDFLLDEDDGGLIPAGATTAEQRTDLHLYAPAALETLLRVDLETPETKEP